MKKMLITLLLAISTGSHATVLKNATDTFPLVSLQQKKVNDNITQDGKLPKASVIFWIDLDKSKSNSGKTIRNVKAKVSINKEGSNDISYAPFALFGGSTFLTGTIGKINNTLKTGDVTIKCNDNDSIQNVKFSNFPQYANAVIIIYYENIKNAIVKEE